MQPPTYKGIMQWWAEGDPGWETGTHARSGTDGNSWTLRNGRDWLPLSRRAHERAECTEVVERSPWGVTMYEHEQGREAPDWPAG